MLGEVKVEQKDLVQFLETLRKDPNALDWFEKNNENYIKTLEEALEGTKKLRELVHAIKSGNACAGELFKETLRLEE